MRIQKVVDHIKKTKNVDDEEAIKIFNKSLQRVRAKGRGVKFTKKGEPIKPKGEGKPLIGNKQFPIMSRIW